MIYYEKNILFITSDQQHWNTIGKFNNEISTPNLDRLCKEGVYFDHAYTVNPTCTPTRATWITGQMPSQHGAWTLGTKLPESVHTINKDFSDAGYRTALIGKAHFQPLHGNKKYPSLESYPILQDLDFWKQYKGKFYGFDHVELARNHTVEAHVGQHYALWLEEKGCKNWRDYFRKPTGNMDEKEKLVWDIPEQYHYNTWIAERTNAMMEQYAENKENFFLWASFFDPHAPYAVPEPWASMYDPNKITLPSISENETGIQSPFLKLSREENPDISSYRTSGFGLHGVHSHLHDDSLLRKQIATYYGMVSMMDHYIGKILDKLDNLGLAENTIVIFTTDHGYFYGQHGLIAKGPFLYDDLIRVPLIVRHPDCISHGKVDHSLHSHLDIPVTMLDCCDIERPDGMGGISQKNVWLCKEEKLRKSLICEHNHERGTVNLRAFVNERYKMVLYYHMDCGEIYDLQADPNELHNLWGIPEYEALKTQLLFEFMQAEFDKEPIFMDRVADA